MPEKLIYNTAVHVAAPAESSARSRSVETLRVQLTRAGFEVYDGDNEVPSPGLHVAPAPSERVLARASVVELVEASSEEEAIAILTRALGAAGFTAYCDAGLAASAFESEAVDDLSMVRR